MSEERKEGAEHKSTIASISSKTGIEFAKYLSTEFVVDAIKAGVEKTGKAAVVSEGLAAASGFAPVVAVAVPIGEILGRGLAEASLTDEDRKNGHKNTVLQDAAKATLVDAKWVAGQAIDFVVDKIPVPGMSAAISPWVEHVGEKAHVSQTIDKTAGLQEHQASAATFYKDAGHELGEQAKAYAKAGIHSTVHAIGTAQNLALQAGASLISATVEGSQAIQEFTIDKLAAFRKARQSVGVEVAAKPSAPKMN